MMQGLRNGVLERSRQDSTAEVKNDPFGGPRRKPHALVDWDSIKDTLSDKQIVVFLDYDGTLTPIVDYPHEAQMTSHARRIVHRLSQAYPVAIVTGRHLDTIREFVKLDTLWFATSHGFNISSPDGKEAMQVAKDSLPYLQKAYEDLKEMLKDIEGALVETTEFCVTVHYRMVSLENVPIVLKIVDEVTARYQSMLKQSAGKMVRELRPNVDWHKGKAVEWLLKSLGSETKTELFPVYIGDDTTDEDAFQRLHQRGEGLTIRIQAIEQPCPTWASHVLYSTEETHRFLQRLCSLKAPSPSVCSS